MTAARFTRRALLGALVVAQGAARGALAARPLRYALALRPARALLGDPVVAVLECAATAAFEAAAFEDASLTLALRREETRAGRAAAGDAVPVLAFPNRGGFQRGDVLMRTGSRARRSLGKGEHLSRELDLVAIYPSETLAPGTLVVSYTIGDDRQTFTGGPAKLAVESGPEAVPALFRRLDGPDLAVRARSAALLHRMTGEVVGYAPDGEAGERAQALDRWRQWWRAIGSRLPWSFDSSGAIFAAQSPRPGARKRGDQLGGVAYLRRAPGKADAEAIAGALSTWAESRTGAPEALRGRVRAADLTVTYPGPEVVFEASGEAGDALRVALDRLARRITPASSPETTGAAIICATLAKFPDRRFVEALSAVETAARGAPGWRTVAATASGLLDLLDPERTL